MRIRESKRYASDYYSIIGLIDTLCLTVKKSRTIILIVSERKHALDQPRGPRKGRQGYAVESDELSDEVARTGPHRARAIRFRFHDYVSGEEIDRPGWYLLPPRHRT